MSNIYQLFRERSQNSVSFIQSSGGEVLATYEDMETRSAQYANLLRNAGLQNGDRVCVQVEKSAENLMLYLGCLRAGLTYLPLNTAYKQDELAYFVSDAEPGMAICSPGAESMFDTNVMTMDKNGLGTLSSNADRESSEFETINVEPDSTAVILYTSGTTGKPKGAMITHGNLVSNSLVLHEAWGWKEGDIMLHSLPIFHVHGLFVATHPAILNGSKIILLDSFNADLVLAAMPEATVYMGVPTHYTRLLASDSLNQENCRNMRLFTSGSAPLLPQTFTAFQERTGHTILERYGMTETGMNTSNPLEGDRKPGTVGPPLKGVTCRIVNDDGSQTELNETGQLEVKGENVFKGYWKLPEKTAEEFTEDGFFRTGDLATIDQDGYISIVGRGKDLIITGGLNVYPKELEEIIDRLPGVSETAVIGLPHSDFGEAVTAVVIQSDDSDTSEEEIIGHMKNTVANFKVPKRVIFLDELPRNTMGKVQKNVLREKFSA